MNAENLTPLLDDITPRTPKEKIASIACHIGAIFSMIPLAGVAVPFIVWQTFKGESDFIDRHGKKAFNFQMTLLLMRIPSYVLTVAVIGFAMIAIIEFVSILFSIIAAIRAGRGLDYSYPFQYPFFR